MKLFGNEGMTLLETLLSMTILSIIIVSLMGFFYQSASVESDNQNKLVSINLARSTLEQLKAEDTPVPGSGETVLPVCSESSFGLCSPVINGKTYTVTIIISEADIHASLAPAEIVVYHDNRQKSEVRLEGAVPR